MTIWIISDTHFYHKNFLGFKDVNDQPIRPFETVDQMNQLMMDNWARLVKPDDHVYHLGDVALGCSSTVCANVIKSLPGKKRLILGNHDRFTSSQYIKMGFEKLKGVHLLGECWLSHFPIHPSSMGKALGNIHGHTHEKGSPEGAYQSACVELTNYSPVPLDLFRQRFLPTAGA